MEILRIGESTLRRLRAHMLGAVWLGALTFQSENRCGEDGPKGRILEEHEKSFKKGWAGAPLAS